MVSLMVLKKSLGCPESNLFMVRHLVKFGPISPTALCNILQCASPVNTLTHGKLGRKSLPGKKLVPQ